MPTQVMGLLMLAIRKMLVTSIGSARRADLCLSE